MAKEKWIQKAHIKKGALHKSLGVPEGEKIPTAKLKKAEHSKDPKTKKISETTFFRASFH